MKYTYSNHPFGSDITSEDIIEAFKKLNTWEEKYRYIIQIGKKIPTMNKAQRELAKKVTGCENDVWIDLYQNENKFHFFADSDARIIKGFIAIILTAINKKNRNEILSLDFHAYLEALGLLDQLSGSRKNGISAIILHIKEQLIH